MRRIHNDDTQRLRAHIAALERQAAGMHAGKLSREGAEGGRSSVPSSAEEVGGEPSQEVDRLKLEVAALQSKCAEYAKEAKKLKFYMSTLPLPAG